MFRWGSASKTAETLRPLWNVSPGRIRRRWPPLSGRQNRSIAPRSPDSLWSTNWATGAWASFIVRGSRAWRVHVAIKFLRRSAAAGAEDRARWLREAQSLSRVRDRGIVQIFQIGEADGWLYLVLELIRGGSLKDRLTKPLSPYIAARFAETIARALAEIHKAGLLHLDLKPSNILLDGPPDSSWEQMTPLIGDFGIARLQDDPVAGRNGASRIWGTPSYMAPEQIEADRGAMEPTADIYAVGATLYHLLTGRPPFVAATAGETFDQVLHRDAVSPRELVPSVPRDLETVCLKCLQKSPQHRYASAAALANDLERFLTGEPVHARRDRPSGACLDVVSPQTWNSQCDDRRATGANRGNRRHHRAMAQGRSGPKERLGKRPRSSGIAKRVD